MGDVAPFVFLSSSSSIVCLLLISAIFIVRLSARSLLLAAKRDSASCAICANVSSAATVFLYQRT